MNKSGKHIGHLVFFLLMLLLSFSGYSQVPVHPDGVIKEDTLEMIENDSVITYIVEMEPITIRDTVLIERIRKKLPPVYFSLTSSLAGVQQFVKAKPSYEDYVRKVNAANVSHYNYSFSSIVWTSLKKTYIGVSVEFMTIKQRFKYTKADSSFVDSDNRFKYTRYKAMVGRWFNKGKKLSYQLTGSINPTILFSYSGFTLAKNEPSQVTRLNTQIDYRLFHLNYSVNFKVLWDLNHYMIELGPYVNLAPHSVTAKNEAYSVTYVFWGFRAGLISKLF